MKNIYTLINGIHNNMRISELREVARSRGSKGWTALTKNDLREFLIPKRVSVAERFRGQYLEKKPEDLLTETRSQFKSYHHH